MEYRKTLLEIEKIRVIGYDAKAIDWYRAQIGMLEIAIKQIEVPVKKDLSVITS